MAPHQERVIVEKRELDEKLEKLHMFCYGGGPVFGGLDVIDRNILEAQFTAMREYSDILQKRIDRFGVTQ